MEQRRFGAPPSRGALLATLKAQTARLKQQIVALYLAGRDPRTPWYAKLVVACVVAYAISPIDLIPDAIPLLGYLDDLLLLPLGIYIAMKLIPAQIWNDCESRAAAKIGALTRSWRAAAIIVLVWLVMIGLVSYFLIVAFLP